MKFRTMIFVLCAVLLSACSSSYSVEEDLKLIFSIPYLSTEVSEEALDENVVIIKERFKDIFSEEELNKHISVQTFNMLHMCEEDITIDSVSFDETASEQYAFSIEMSSDSGKYTSEGSIRYEGGKIVYFIINEYPEYVE